MRSFNKLFTALLVSLFMISSLASLSDAKSLNPLEIGFPREAGTGSPAIPATHPVFRAYPGVAYTVRPAIYGGAYPYTFSLANQPEGMVIDSATGLISWPDSRATTGPITLTVTDADGTQAQSTWSVTVSTSGFVFVDSAYSGVETGSISQPYSSIAAMLNAATTATDIVYFRAGTHTLPLRGPQLYWVSQGCRLTGKPSAWIGYPGEAVTIDMAQHYFEGAPYVYFSSLSFINIPDWAVRAASNAAYSVIRDSSFSAARAQYTTGHAASVYSTEGSSAGTGYYAAFQNNSLTGSSGVGLVSLKEQNHALIEHNTVSGVTVGSQGSKALIENVQNNSLLTVRRNDMRSEYNSVNPLAGNGNNSSMEVTYNFFKGTRIVVWIGGNQSYPPSKTDLYRNTIHGHLIVNYLDGNNCSASGPYSFDGNVFISDGSPYVTVDYIGFREGVNLPATCFPRTSSIIDNTWPVSDVIDADGNLLPAYAEFVGEIGWQLAAVPVPGTLAVTPAAGLTATGAVGGPFSPSAATYTLRNTGNDPIDWSASAAQGWLELSATGGSLAPGSTATVTATLNSLASSLAIGAYSDTVTFTNLTNGNGTASRNVTLTVTPLPVSLTLAVLPSAAGSVSASPAKSAYDIGEMVTLTATPSLGYAFAGWSGDAAGTTSPLVITIDGQKTVTALFTALPGTLEVTPADGFAAAGDQGGTFSPSSATYTLLNAGTTAIDWSASATQSWLSLSSAGGSLAPGATVTVTASLNSDANSLVPGAFSDTVTFTNLTNGNGSTTRPVTLAVNQKGGGTSFNPLEIGFPREAGTGSPAIPATHPVFRAYPGVAYTVRPAIYGGAYPYTFSLANQPEGMVIDSATGLISWPDPRATTGPITLTVTDADGTQAQSTWSVTVSTSGFVFVDSAYSGVETGSISQPYSSIAAMLNAATTATDIVCFRAGTHTLPLRGPQLYWVGQGCRLTGKPSAWIGYPGEAVTIDMAQHYFEGAPYIYFSSLSFINIPDWAVRAASNAAYSVIRDSSFSVARAQYTTGHAASVYSTEGSSAGTGHFAVFQNNTLSNSSGVGLVSLKEQNHALIEHNTVSGVTVGTQGSKALIENVQNNALLTIRKNDLRSTLDGVTPLAGNGNRSTTEITYNFFKATATAIWIGGTQSSPPGKTDLYRNTIQGLLFVNYLDGNNCSASGPYSFGNSVLISRGSTSYPMEDYISFRGGVNAPATCFPRTSNIIDNTWPVSDVIDADGNLLPAYAEFVGEIGWQLAAVPVPGTLAVTPAAGLTATGAVGGPFSPSAATYTLRNTGNDPIDWSASAAQGWLELSATGGSLAPGSTTTVTATLNSLASSLAIGAYSDTVTFTNLTNGNGTASRNVTLTVTPPPVSLALAVLPSAAGSVSASPAKSAYDIGEMVTLTATPSLGYAFAGWSGDAAGTTSPLVITIDGQKSVTAVFTALPGTLEVTPADGFAAAGDQGGTFSPSSATYTLLNAGTTAIDWSASATQSWLSLSSAGGSLAPGATVVVTASLNSDANSLVPGSYSDTVSFTNLTNGTGSTTRPVTLAVNQKGGGTSFNPLEIGFPREAGTGSPAIPATHPVFRAYPGVAYTVRPAIYGGAYPYTFSLANQPEGMVIDSATGLISWPDPRATTGPITLTVTDADGTQAQSTWSVTVSTSGFVFVDSAYSGVETGSISQPYSSIAAMLNAATTATDIVYFRAGTHTLPLRGPQLYWVNQGCRLTAKPSAWLGYPGEAVTIDMAQHYFEGAPYVYFSSLSFINIPDWAVRAATNAAYSVIRDSSFSVARAQYTTGHAASVYSNDGSSAGTGYYAAFQNNTLTGSSGVGLVSLKEQNHALIEHNTVSGVTAGTQGSKALIENVQNNSLLTIRKNDLRSTLDGVTPLAGNGNRSTTEITYNFFKGTATAIWIGGTQSSPPGKTDLYRNTIQGLLFVNYLDGSNCSASGPYSFGNSVLISRGSASYPMEDYISFRGGVNAPATCFPRTSSIIDNTWPVSDVIDADGNLLPAYAEFVGEIGWQLAH